MMNTIRTLAVLVLALSFPLAAVAQEGGGTSGADFLIAPPGARVEAMGGVADPLGTGLEAMSYNAAALAALPGIRLQLTIDPLPNEVTDSALGFGFPLLGGYAAAGVQLLNAGGFTFFNELGQPQETVNVFDAAAGLSYAHYLWRSISLGADLKAIWRSLGSENALAVAGDLGATAWFETPHVGQRPKPPTRKQLEDEFLKRKAGIDAEKQKETSISAKQSTEARKALEATEKTIAGLDADLAKAADDKKEAVAAKKQEAEAKREAQRAELERAQSSESVALEAIETWYQTQLAKAQALYDKKLEDLDRIVEERKTLFAVIDDPAQELTPEMVDASIDAGIEKTRGLLAERTTAADQRKTAYEQHRTAQAEDTRKAIAGYEALLNEATGPQGAALAAEIETLKVEKAGLEQDKAANKDRLAELAKLIPAKEKELAGLSADLWVKRLQERIAAKQRELKQAEADTAAMAQATGKAIADATAVAERDVKDFDVLRASLQKELKKAKLKRELDRVEARSQAAADKVQAGYKAKEKALYLRLLAALYRHEEGIFQDRLAAARDAAAIRAFDFAGDHEKARESLDDGWAFDERLLSAKIVQLSKDVPKGGQEPAELAAAREERAAREAAWKKAVADFDTKQKSFDAAEKSTLEDSVAVITAEQTHVRLVYLQTDKPYLNTAVGAGVRNIGSPVKFVAEAVPLPMSAVANLSYALVNVQDHNVKLTTQLEVPLLDVWSWSVGIGVEYVFANIASARVGYNVNQLAYGLNAFSAGLGVRLAAGFTEYAVDYAFKPLAGYGFQHSIGVTISF
jgi:hypothetical protein